MVEGILQYFLLKSDTKLGEMDTLHIVTEEFTPMPAAHLVSASRCSYFSRDKYCGVSSTTSLPPQYITQPTPVENNVVLAAASDLLC